MILGTTHRRRRHNSPCDARVHAAAAFLLVASVVPEAQAQIQTCLDTDDVCPVWFNVSEPSVVVNWESFEAAGFDPNWEAAFEHCVKNAIERWNHVGSSRVRLRWGGYVTRVEPDHGEILIRGVASGTVLADATVEFHADRSRIRVYRSAPGSEVNDYNFFWPHTPVDTAEPFDMQALLTHELGHSLGLKRHQDGGVSTMNPTYHWTEWRFGPYVDDYNRLQALYGYTTTNRLEVNRSLDDGVTWANVSSSLDGYPTYPTMQPGAVRQGSNYLVAYTKPTKEPAFLYAGNPYFDNAPHMQFSSLQSWYGVSADGSSGHMMMAYVSPVYGSTNNAMVVRVLRTPNAGEDWFYSNPPSSSVSYGTPAIQHLYGNTWLLAYARLDRAAPWNTGRIAIRLTDDNGSTWSDEVLAQASYRSLVGLSAVARNQLASSADVEIRFSWASSTSSITNYRVRAFEAHVQTPTGAPPELSFTGMIYEHALSRSPPAAGESSTASPVVRRHILDGESLFYDAFDGGTYGGISWSANALSPDSPAIAADKNASNLYMYYVQE